MSELRNDLVTSRVVLLAPGRSARPHTVPTEPPETGTPSCPFCPEHEHETPPEIMRIGDGAPDTTGWRVRVVPNLYPIVGGPEPGPGGAGAHEVVVFDPDHARDLGRLDDTTVVELFRVMRDRARVHADAGLAHVQVLVNHGRAAGASIAHPHAQILAIDFVPPAVRDALQRYAAARTDVVLADADAAAVQGGTVADHDARAWCPWGAASPFETRIAAVDAGARFERAPDSALDAVARTTRDIVAGIRTVLGNVAYNVTVHNAPTRPLRPPDAAAGEQDYHWYVTVVPRVTIVAGFELGTGVLVNTVDPVQAAALLRDALGEAAS